MDEITVEFPASVLPDRVYPEYWQDTGRRALGGEFAVSSSFAVRAGAYYDTHAVPDRTIERQYTDNNKIGLSSRREHQVQARGASIPPSTVSCLATRTVPNNAVEVMALHTAREQGAWRATKARCSRSS